MILALHGERAHHLSAVWWMFHSEKSTHGLENMVFLPHGGPHPLSFLKGCGHKDLPLSETLSRRSCGTWLVWLSLHENTSLSVLFQIEYHAQIIQLVVEIVTDRCMCTTCT